MQRQHWPSTIGNLVTLSLENLDFIAECNRELEDSKFLDVRAMRTIQDVKDWYAADYSRSFNLILYASQTGYVSVVWDIHSSAEIGIVLKKSARGNGHKLVSLVCRTAFRLGIRRVTARIVEGNIRAVKCFQKAGFSIDGTLREEIEIDNEYKNAYILSLLPGDS